MHRIMEKVYLDHYLVSQKLEKLVVHDQLTGVYNRNKLEELSIPDSEELIFQKELPVSIFILDIDFFKSVNDKYGHEAGDIVLVQMAQTLKNSVRSSDYVIRWGGEEFIIILPGCNAEYGMNVAEKIRKNVEESDNGICHITISIGVALYQGGSYHDTIEMADQALYQAKRGGRNMVVEYKGE